MRKSVNIFIDFIYFFKYYVFKHLFNKQFARSLKLLAFGKEKYGQIAWAFVFSRQTFESIVFVSRFCTEIHLVNLIDLILRV